MSKANSNKQNSVTGRKNRALSSTEIENMEIEEQVQSPYKAVDPKITVMEERTSPKEENRNKDDEVEAQENPAEDEAKNPKKRPSPNKNDSSKKTKTEDKKEPLQKLRKEAKQCIDALFNASIPATIKRLMESNATVKVAELIEALQPKPATSHHLFRHFKQQYPTLNTSLTKRCYRKVHPKLLDPSEEDYDSLLESNTSKLAYEVIYKDLLHAMTAVKPDALMKKLQTSESSNDDTNTNNLANTIVSSMIQGFEEQTRLKVGEVISETDLLNEMCGSESSSSDEEIAFYKKTPKRISKPTAKGAEYIVEEVEAKKNRKSSPKAPVIPQVARVPPAPLGLPRVTDTKRGYPDNVQSGITQFVSTEILQLSLNQSNVEFLDHLQQDDFAKVKVATLSSMKKVASMEQQKKLSMISFHFRYTHKPEISPSMSIVDPKFIGAFESYFETHNPVFLNRPAVNHLMIPQVFIDAMLVLGVKRVKNLTFQVAFDRMVKFLFLCVGGFLTQFGVKAACAKYPTFKKSLLRLTPNLDISLEAALQLLANNCNNYFFAKEIGWRAALSMATYLPELHLFLVEEYAIDNVILHPLIRCQVLNKKKTMFQDFLPTTGTSAELDELFFSLMLSVLFPETLKENPWKNFVFGMVVFMTGLLISPDSLDACQTVMFSLPDGEEREAILTSCGK